MIRSRPIVLALAAAPFLFCACTTNPSLGSGDPAGLPPGAASSNADGGAPDSGGAPGADGGAGSREGGGPSPQCTAVVSTMLSAPITPPAKWAGIDLGAGANPKGMTIDEVNATECVTFMADVPPATPGGYRMAYLGEQDIFLTYNIESRIVHQVSVGNTYKGTATFHSRGGGAYGDHTYEVGIARLTRDGADFMVDWAGDPTFALNELYDALVATFAPAAAPVANCKTAGSCLIVRDDGAGQAVFGARPVPLYMIFDPNTSAVKMLYNLWDGGKADCTTLQAAREAMDWSPVIGGYADVHMSAELGGLNLSRKGGSNPKGMTVAEADAVLCGGTAATPPDSGYGAMQWGPSGELVVEYNRSSNVIFKVIASAGYQGTIDADDGIGDKYSIGIGRLTKNGIPMKIDWSDPKLRVTELSNAINGVTEPDCIATGNCTFALDDGAGYSMFGFPEAQLYVRVTKATSTPVQIFTLWPDGQ